MIKTVLYVFGAIAISGGISWCLVKLKERKGEKNGR